jgi:predicted Zn-ribbon and HTH transcriptional regulator
MKMFITCPKCHSAKVRASQTSSSLDKLRRYFLIRPYRCRECQWRFYACSLLRPAQASSHSDHSHKQNPEQSDESL